MSSAKQRKKSPNAVPRAPATWDRPPGPPASWDRAPVAQAAGTLGERTPGERRLDLRLAAGTPAEAFERVAQALDAGDITIAEARQLSDVLERRLHVVDAERWRAQLLAIQARADEAARLAGARALPAARETVEVEPERRFLPPAPPRPRED